MGGIAAFPAVICCLYRRIANEPAAAALDGARILDTSRSPTFYSGRWCEPGTKHTGLFVARRPQLYGAALWCVAEVEQGVVAASRTCPLLVTSCDLTTLHGAFRPLSTRWLEPRSAIVVRAKTRPQRLCGSFLPFLRGANAISQLSGRNRKPTNCE
jgi:hypothetical protein